MRQTAAIYQVPNTSLQRRLKGTARNTVTNRGRKRTLTDGEEKAISQAALKLSHDGTPLSKDCFRDLVQFCVKTLPQERGREACRVAENAMLRKLRAVKSRILKSTRQERRAKARIIASLRQTAIFSGMFI